MGAILTKELKIHVTSDGSLSHKRRRIVPYILNWIDLGDIFLLKQHFFPGSLIRDLYGVNRRHWRGDDSSANQMIEFMRQHEYSDKMRCSYISITKDFMNASCKTESLESAMSSLIPSRDKLNSFIFSNPEVHKLTSDLGNHGDHVYLVWYQDNLYCVFGYADPDKVLSHGYDFQKANEVT